MGFAAPVVAAALTAEEIAAAVAAASAAGEAIPFATAMGGASMGSLAGPELTAAYMAANAPAEQGLMGMLGGGMSSLGKAFSGLPPGAQSAAMQGLLGGQQQQPPPQAVPMRQPPQAPPPQVISAYNQPPIKAPGVAGLLNLGPDDERRRRMMRGAY